MRPALLSLLLLTLPLYGQDEFTTDAKATASIAEVSVGPYAAEYIVKLAPRGSRVKWSITPRPEGSYLRNFGGSTRLIFAGPPGRYVATASIEVVRLGKSDKPLADYKAGDILPFEADTTELSVAFVLTGGVPVPPGPVPPGPVPPGPVPPGPVPPGPTPAPIPVAGLHVLLVFETADLSRYPPSMVASWSAASVDAYLKAKGAAVRRWDANVDTSGAEKKWQDAMKRPRAGLPWIIVSNGTTGYEGPPPATATELLALLKTFGGE